jgi:glycosyltransferase involved in cell wall biosynthesis
MNERPRSSTTHPRSTTEQPRVTFLANPYSVHVGLWCKAAAECRIPVHIETASRPRDERPPGATIEHRTPDWLRGPNTLRYLWMAVANRFRRRRPDEIVHAHCTSGNGFVAWLSGDPYILTTYGTEVMLADRRGRIFAWMIGRILRGAERLTASSTEMVDELTEKHNIPRERIHLFDLGIEQDVFYPLDAPRRARLRADLGVPEDEPVWVSIKRAVPWNHTTELLQGFLQYCRSNPRGRLVVLCGDSLPDYVARVRAITQASPFRDRVHLVESWLDQAGVARWLQAADFCLSVADSDQMAHSILESMACGATPILIDIPGYKPLKERGAPVIWIDDGSPDALCEVYTRTAVTLPEARLERAGAAGRYIDEYHSRRMVEHHLRRLYNLHPAADELAARAA